MALWSILVVDYTSSFVGSLVPPFVAPILNQFYFPFHSIALNNEFPPMPFLVHLL